MQRFTLEIPEVSIKLLIPLFSVMIISISNAQELEPRVYANLPKNLNVAALAYSFSTGEISTNPASPFQDFQADIHTVAAAYVRTFDLLGKLARVQVIAPFSFFSGSVKFKGMDTSGTRNGLLDARVRFGLNIFGSPALDIKSFQKYRQRTIFGTSLVVSIPTGLYYKEKFVNIGANRWGFKPEVGISHQFKKFYIEMYTGVWFFTDNTSYLTDKTLSQAPLYSVQGHISYALPSQIWFAINGNYAVGGQSSVNGVKQDDYQRKWRLGGVVSYPFSWQHSVKFQYHTGVSTNIGSGYDIFIITYQFVWL